MKAKIEPKMLERRQMRKKKATKAVTSWVAKRAMKGGKLAKEPIIAMLNNQMLIPVAAVTQLGRNFSFRYIFFFCRVVFFYLFLLLLMMSLKRKKIYLFLIDFLANLHLRCLRMFDYRVLNDGGITRSVNFSKSRLLPFVVFFRSFFFSSSVGWLVCGVRCVI